MFKDVFLKIDVHRGVHCEVRCEVHCESTCDCLMFVEMGMGPRAFQFDWYHKSVSYYLCWQCKYVSSPLQTLQTIQTLESIPSYNPTRRHTLFAPCACCKDTVKSHRIHHSCRISCKVIVGLLNVFNPRPNPISSSASILCNQQPLCGAIAFVIMLELPFFRSFRTEDCLKERLNPPQTCKSRKLPSTSTPAARIQGVYALRLCAAAAANAHWYTWLHVLVHVYIRARVCARIHVVTYTSAHSPSS